MSALDLKTHGAALHHSAALSLLPQIDAALANTLPERAGTRLHGITALADLLTSGPIHAIAARYLSIAVHPVRAILFDKTPTTNWALGWHQDRTIVVRERRDTPGYGPWTLKAGLHHVEPPFAIIDAMLTLRIHLDDVPENNGPLLIAPARNASARSQNAISSRRSSGLEHSPVSRSAATCGPMLRRSATRPPLRRPAPTGAFFRWTTVLPLFPTALNGAASEMAAARPSHP